MQTSAPELLSLFRTLVALKPYLRQVVIVGGWVPFLYRKYGNIPARHPAVHTTDIDIAVPLKVPLIGRASMDSLLLEAGFTAQITGSYGPVVKYELISPATEIEFITPEIGRPGKPVITIQEGLKAQALRYVEILLGNTRQIKINDHAEGMSVLVDVKLPSPAAYIYQKALTLSLRKPKAAKDLYYIFDLLDSSVEMQTEIPSEIKLLQAQYTPRWFNSAIRNLERYFPDISAEGPTLIASQYTGPMNTDMIQNYSHQVFRDLIDRLR